eukprot:Ihof_evm1s1015 gene=Ihof_evmTU1s1015
MAFFNMGKNTFKVPMSMHKENRTKLFSRCSTFPSNGVIFMKGGDITNRYDTDASLVFRQESFFLYLFGTHHDGCMATMELGTNKTVLFIPRLPIEYAVWMSKINPPEFYKEELGLDEVRFVDEIPEYMKALAPSTIYTLKGVNTDSGSTSEEATFEGMESYSIDRTSLYPEIVECRVIKSETELELMRWVNSVSSKAHIEVMKAIQPGMMEYELESLFLHECYSKGGARFTAYTCICGAGESGATLHYGQNNKLVSDGQMCLFDMGCEYHGYASDITCSFPANGKFNPQQKIVYNAVLKANKAVMSTLKEGVLWPDMHRLAERVLLEELKASGLLKGDVDKMMEAFLGNLFMPHGLGHLMGLDVHDVGGYPHDVTRSCEPGLKSLRCGRMLKAGMVITIEPGCYFIRPLLLPALEDPIKSQFLVKEKILEYMDFGGVRIE